MRFELSRLIFARHTAAMSPCIKLLWVIARFFRIREAYQVLHLLEQPNCEADYIIKTLRVALHFI